MRIEPAPSEAVRRAARPAATAARAAAARAAGRAVRVPRVAGHAPGGRLGGAHDRQLGQVGLADDHRAGAAQPRARSRRPAVAGPPWAAVPWVGDLAGHVLVSFTATGTPSSGRSSRRPRARVGLVGLGQRPLGHHRRGRRSARGRSARSAPGTAPPARASDTSPARDQLGLAGGAGEGEVGGLGIGAVGLLGHGQSVCVRASRRASRPARRVATAIAAMPSPRPTKPMPSLVVNLTFTCQRAARAPPARRSRMRVAVRAELGRLADDRGVDVARRQPLLGQEPAHLLEQLDRVGVAPALVGVREVLADVAEPGGAEQRVDHRVGQDVGVGVARSGPARVLDLDPAEHEPPALVQAVRVVADARARCSSRAAPAALAALEHGQLGHARARAATRPPARTRGRGARARGRRSTAPPAGRPRGTSRGTPRAGRSPPPACAARRSRPRSPRRTRRSRPSPARRSGAGRRRAAAPPCPRP